MQAPGPRIVNRPATPARTSTPAQSTGMPSSATTQTLQAAMGGSRTSPAMPAMPAVDARLNKSLQAILGERFYRMGNGQVIELPSDMTQADAAKLEAEALAATQRLGKGPSPQAVPDVRKAADKSKKDLGKPNAKGKKGGAAGRRAGTRTGAGKGRLRDTGGKVAQFLIGKARPVLARGTAMLAKLSANEQTHDNATQKLQQSEKAVVSPVSENQSRSNASQVTAVGAMPAPVVDEKKGKSTLQESLRDNVPRSIEDVDNFKRDMKGQHVGADVLKVTQADKNAVVSTFADMSQTPPPAAPEQTPEALPPAELAPGTPGLQLGQNAVAPLQREHTDVSKFTSEADTKLKEEGVTQEQLDMVDSGDLASANKEKKGMNDMAAKEPAAIQQFAKQEATKVDANLQQEEKKQRSAVSARRKNGLGATGEKQKHAKSALEKKRDEVAAHINGLHKATQTRVTKKLADLETQSMKRFDDGNARATRDFEDSVKRDIDAFKDDRYSGWFGWARKAKDWLKGMDDLPGVKAIFDRNRAAFVSTVEALVADISAENKRVIQECKDDLERTRVEIKDYVGKLGPALKTIGNKIAGEVNEQLDAMDGFIKKKEEELQQQLADKQQAAIKAIDEKIEKMKEAMAGALAKLGKLLLWAAKKFFTWALTKFGYSLGEIEGIISKGAAVLKAIFTQPIAFVKNLVRAAIMGFENFGKNFLKHLKDALFEWLTGSLEGLKLPSVWNLQGIVGVALQMIGISYANLRKHMVTAMGETVVSGLEKTFTLVKTLVTEGPMAAWEQLKGLAGEMSDAFVAAVKDFIKQKIIEQAIQWVVSLFVPGAGIVKAVIGIYDTVVFFIQKAKQIAKMVANFLGSIAEIAAGNVGAAAQAMEDGLARGLSLVISFLASLLRLNGITAKIRDGIQKIRGKVDDVLAKLAKWVAAKANVVFGKAKAVAGSVKAAAGRLLSWAATKAKFKDEDGHSHTIFVQDGSTPKLMIASDPVAAEQFLDIWLKKKSDTFKDDNKAEIAAVRKAAKVSGDLVEIITKKEKANATDPALPDLQQQLLAANVTLSGVLSDLISNDKGIGKMRDRYLLEGLTGTYASMPKPKGDSFTADHQPQAAILEEAAEFDYFDDNGALVKRAAGRAQKGLAINLHHIRHTAGRTYGGKGGGTKKTFIEDVRKAVGNKTKPASQRTAAVGVLHAHLILDVKAMNEVAKPSSAHWTDIRKGSGKKEDKEALIKDVSARIINGEKQMLNQDLDSLKN